MKITAITCTYGRPEAFALCQKYMARQTRQPDHWLVLDGPEPMPVKVLNAITEGKIQGDAVVWIEDDDHYRTDWIEWCEKQIERGYDIVGEGLALYYHVGRRWMSNCRNTRHASLCSTAIRANMLPRLAAVIEGFDNPFFDTRLWRLDARRYLHLPKDGERRVVGIKGMPSLRAGYSAEHKAEVPPDVTPDPSLFHLWKAIGQDAAAYAPFQRK